MFCAGAKTKSFQPKFREKNLVSFFCNRGVDFTLIMYSSVGFKFRSCIEEESKGREIKKIFRNNLALREMQKGGTFTYVSIL